MLSELNSSVTTTLSENEHGDLILDFPVELLQILGWKAGDTLEISTFAGRVIFSRVRKAEDGDCVDDCVSEPN